jgi:hypothetical protein
LEVIVRRLELGTTRTSVDAGGHRGPEDDGGQQPLECSQRSKSDARALPPSAGCGCACRLKEHKGEKPPSQQGGREAERQQRRGHSSRIGMHVRLFLPPLLCSALASLGRPAAPAPPVSHAVQCRCDSSGTSRGAPMRSLGCGLVDHSLC